MTPILLLAAAALAADVDPHRAPAPSLAEKKVVSSDRQGLLAELWQRRILPPEAEAWSPEDLKVLERVRAAERLGAINLLRRRAGNVPNLVVEHRKPGERRGLPRLTKDGYLRWARLRAQDALAYFEERGVAQKWGFQLTDLKARPLFGKDGLLTPVGDEIYNRGLANLPAHWMTPNGEVYGNRPPPKGYAYAREAAPAQEEPQTSADFPSRKAVDGTAPPPMPAGASAEGNGTPPAAQTPPAPEAGP